MRNYALVLLLISNLVIYLTQDMSGISGGSLSFLLTLVVVVLAAFTVSALLRNARSISMTKNYVYSGLVGLILGIIFYFWVKQSIEGWTKWFNDNGLTVLLILNVICALVIFFVSKPKGKIKAVEE